jgi:hypothetical protein
MTAGAALVAELRSLGTKQETDGQPNEARTFAAVRAGAEIVLGRGRWPALSPSAVHDGDASMTFNAAEFLANAARYYSSPSCLHVAEVSGTKSGMNMRRVKLSDKFRQAVDASGLSRYRISKELGIAESTMSRFMAGGGLSMENLDAVADLLGLSLSTAKPRRRKGG